MKHFEYLYNIHCYFYFQAYLKSLWIINTPLFLIIGPIYLIPFIKQYYKKRGVDNPLQWHKEKVQEKKIHNLLVMEGAHIAMVVVFLLYLGFFNIGRKIFYADPSLYPSLIIELVIIGLATFGTDFFFTDQDDKGEKYIKQFDTKNATWRIKWIMVTTLSPFLAILFAIFTI